MRARRRLLSTATLWNGRSTLVVPYRGILVADDVVLTKYRERVDSKDAFGAVKRACNRVPEEGHFRDPVECVLL